MFGLITSLIAIIVIIGAVVIFKEWLEYGEAEEAGDQPVRGRSFYRKYSLMTPAEQNFFAVLFQAVDKNKYIIFPQVRLSSIIGAARGSRFGTLSMINQKSVDYLLCDERYAPVLVIELDDSSHATRKRRYRDSFLDKALTEAGVKILHVAVRQEYQVDYLRKMIIEILGN